MAPDNTHGGERLIAVRLDVNSSISQENQQFRQTNCSIAAQSKRMM